MNGIKVKRGFLYLYSGIEKKKKLLLFQHVCNGNISFCVCHMLKKNNTFFLYALLSKQYALIFYIFSLLATQFRQKLAKKRKKFVFLLVAGRAFDKAVLFTLTVAIDKILSMMLSVLHSSSCKKTKKTTATVTKLKKM